MKKTINIEGMVCGNCVMHVKNALMAVSGVTNVDVSLEKRRQKLRWELKYLM